MTGEASVGKDQIKIDEDCIVEINREGEGVWQLSFRDGAGNAKKAPEPDQVKAESVDSGFIVRVLAVASKDDNTLTATGKTDAANYARISVERDGAWKTQYKLLANTETPTAPLPPFFTTGVAGRRCLYSAGRYEIALNDVVGVDLQAVTV